MSDVTHLGEKRVKEREREQPEVFERDYTKYDFKDPVDRYEYIGKPGLSREVVEEISRFKGEPDWMREFRLRAYEVFIKKRTSPTTSSGPSSA